MNAVRLQALHRTPPSSRLCRLWSQKEDLQRAWNRERRAAWDQAGLSHCPHDSLVTIRDEARLRQGHNDQSHRVHRCSETTLTEESQFHIIIPLGIEPGSLMTGSKWVDHWTSGTVYECNEIAGSPQCQETSHKFFKNLKNSKICFWMLSVNSGNVAVNFSWGFQFFTIFSPRHKSYIQFHLKLHTIWCCCLIVYNWISLLPVNSVASMLRPNIGSPHWLLKTSMYVL